MVRKSFISQLSRSVMFERRGGSRMFRCPAALLEEDNFDIGRFSSTDQERQDIQATTD